MEMASLTSSTPPSAIAATNDTSATSTAPSSATATYSTNSSSVTTATATATLNSTTTGSPHSQVLLSQSDFNRPSPPTDPTPPGLALARSVVNELNMDLDVDDDDDDDEAMPTYQEEQQGPPPAFSTPTRPAPSTTDAAPPESPLLTPRQSPGAALFWAEESSECDLDPDIEETPEDERDGCPGSTPDEDILNDTMNICEDRHVALFQRYLSEKKQLVDNNTVVEVGKGSKKLTWTVREDVKRDECPGTEFYWKDIGVRGFDFGRRTVEVTNKKLKRKRINFFDLLTHLWPGEWKKQLSYLNERIGKDLQKNNQDRATSKKFISEHEFFVFFALLIVARLYGRKGNIWDGKENPPIGILPHVDYSCHMKKSRFNFIKTHMAYVFADEGLKGHDEWWQVVGGIDGFNENRRTRIQAPNDKVLDETMSAFRPTKTPKGDLPHLSYIARKPEPLGTEFKTLAAAYMGVFLHFHLCRSKNDPIQVINL